MDNRTFFSATLYNIYARGHAGAHARKAKQLKKSYLQNRFQSYAFTRQKHSF